MMKCSRFLVAAACILAPVTRCAAGARRCRRFAFPAAIAFAVACIAPALWLGEATAAEQRPNIVLMMGDDHGWEETGYNRHPHVRTPVLDEMASQGLRFNRFYAAHPSCSPTRGSFLTGRHPNRYGTFAPGWSIRPEEVTIAHILSKAGYHCGHFGKWHVGPVKSDSPTNPGAMGFDEWLSHDNFFELNPPLSRNGGDPQVFQGESSEILIDETIEFIGRARKQDKPFFAVVWFGSPHEPFSGLPSDLELYDEVPKKYPQPEVTLTSNETGRPTRRPIGEVLRERYAEITAMDRAIGTLRDFLADEDLRKDTIVFYCGDNGTPSCGVLNSPHRGMKATMYQGGILVPGIVEWPARISQPRATDISASTSDLLPTLCSIVGQPLPDRPLDGVDLSPAFEGLAVKRTEPLYFWSYETGRLNGAEPWIEPRLQQGTTPLVKYLGGLRTRNFRNVKHPEIAEADYHGPRAVVGQRYKLVLDESGDGVSRRELFDLKADPAEKHNLAEEKPEIVRDMEQQMRAWQTSVLKSVRGEDYQK